MRAGVNPHQPSLNPQESCVATEAWPSCRSLLQVPHSPILDSSACAVIEAKQASCLKGRRSSTRAEGSILFPFSISYRHTEVSFSR